MRFFCYCHAYMSKNPQDGIRILNIRWISLVYHPFALHVFALHIDTIATYYLLLTTYVHIVRIYHLWWSWRKIRNVCMWVRGSKPNHISRWCWKYNARITDQKSMRKREWISRIFLKLFVYFSGSVCCLLAFFIGRCLIAEHWWMCTYKFSFAVWFDSTCFNSTWSTKYVCITLSHFNKSFLFAFMFEYFSCSNFLFYFSCFPSIIVVYYFIYKT